MFFHLLTTSSSSSSHFLQRHGGFSILKLRKKQHEFGTVPAGTVRPNMRDVHQLLGMPAAS